ncbi:MAG TPA: cation-translocating P-type ATPase [Candidatus Onthovivens sp.]|nr:cation-translocating P-type ATPase [Candidatus Onthovivens sp.]
MKKYSFFVEGLRCSSCVASLEAKLSKNPNIKEINVNLLAGTLSFLGEDIDENEILSLIASLGFKGSIEHKGMINLNKDHYFKLSELIVLLIFALPLIYIAFSNMIFKDLPKFDYINMMVEPLAYSLISTVLFIPIFVIGFKFFIPGVKALIRLRPNMDSLITIATLVSTTYSLVYLILLIVTKEHQYAHNIIFESGAMVIIFIYFGKYIEEVTLNSARDSLNKLINLLPINAIRLNKEVNEEVCVNALEINDLILVKAGEVVPIDGVISEGSGLIDVSSLLGESKLKEVKKGDVILGGSILTSDYLKIRVLKVSNEASLNNILRLVSEANGKKGAITRFIDKVSLVFVPIMLLIALITFIVWISISGDFATSLNYFVSTIVIACPCAIGLATPMAIILSSLRGHKEGFIYKNNYIFDEFKNIDTVVFDKTGTLTNGQFKVQKIKNYSKLDLKEIINVLYSLEVKSSHPIGLSLIKYLKENYSDLKEYELKVTNIPSRGIEGVLKNDTYLIGNKSLLNEKDQKLIVEEEATNLYLIKNETLIASIALSDDLIPGAKELITYLKSLNKEIHILTGDNELITSEVAKLLEISNYKANALPNEKYDFIKSLKENKQNILYVGDGINDAPSLALANVSIASYNSSDIASSNASIILLKEDLRTIIKIFKSAHYTYSVIRLNVFWAFIYNIIGVILATGMFSSLGITLMPYMSALMMSLSSILVILTSLSIKIKKLK